MKETTEAPNEAPVAQPAAQAAEPDPFAVIEKLNAENAELKDRLLRALAEMENLRRRTEREVADARAYGVANLARDMLSVADNLARAVESLPAEERAAADAALKALIEGVELTERDLHAALGRYGVTKLSPEGEKFDPNFHQAMYEIPNDSLPAGSVADVVQSGWKIGERVLRPALVAVSKGGPKAEPKNGDAPPAAPEAPRESLLPACGEKVRLRGREGGRDGHNAKSASHLLEPRGSAHPNAKSPTPALHWSVLGVNVEPSAGTLRGLTRFARERSELCAARPWFHDPPVSWPAVRPAPLAKGRGNKNATSERRSHREAAEAKRRSGEAALTAPGNIRLPKRDTP